MNPNISSPPHTQANSSLGSPVEVPPTGAAAPTQPPEMPPSSAVHPPPHGTTATLAAVETKKRPLPYEWRVFAPSGVTHFLLWLRCGVSPHSKLSEDQATQNFRSLARMLSLLQEYESRFGLPQGGGPDDQQWVLEELCLRLFGAGVPIWALQPAMNAAAVGLTGSYNTKFCLLPRSGMIFFSHGKASQFEMERGFCMYRVTFMERVLVRLASFGTNTRTTTSVRQETFPRPEEWSRPPDSVQSDMDRDELAQEILNRAADGTGLFFLTRSLEESRRRQGNGRPSVDSFWIPTLSARELFTRLATLEATNAIAAMDQKAYYSPPVRLLARFVSAAGAAGLWFSGSWWDMLAAGLLGMVVALCERAHVWKYERAVFEVGVSFLVGMSAGFIQATWPGKTCWGAISVAAVIDILQGFKICFSVVELMSKHTITGSADLVEASLFTALIATSLSFGHQSMSRFREDYSGTEGICDAPVDELWKLLLAPITSLAWAVNFTPRYVDLPLMAYHGILALGVYNAVDQHDEWLGQFVAALSVTLSAGIVSRFTGRQAIGDTITGLYGLVPGAYWVNGLFDDDRVNTEVFGKVILGSVIIGLGAWTGTLLCSPTVLGSNPGLWRAASAKRARARANMEDAGMSPTTGAMLYF